MTLPSSNLPNPRNLELRRERIRARHQPGVNYAALEHLTVDERAARTYVAEWVRLKFGTQYPSAAEFLANYAPAWDGGYSEASGKFYEPVWTRVLQRCQDHRIDPLTYLNWWLRTWASRAMPTPSDLDRNPAVAGFLQREPPEDFARAELAANQALLKRSISTHRRIYGYSLRASQRAALLSPHRRFEALFMYCAATAFGFSDIAQQAYPAAVRAYLGDRGLFDKIWGSLLPPALTTQTSAALLATLQRQ